MNIYFFNLHFDRFEKVAFAKWSKHLNLHSSKMESITDETNIHFANDNDLEILVIAYIQTLKRGNKKCGREEVCRLVNDSLNNGITKEAFELIPNSMIANHSVNLTVIRKRECLPLPKESCQISDDKVDQNNINFAKKFNLFKSGIVDDFDRLKQAFFSEVNRFKEEIFESNVVEDHRTYQKG